jgi:hypothetical protein
MVIPQYSLSSNFYIIDLAFESPIPCCMMHKQRECGWERTVWWFAPFALEARQTIRWFAPITLEA